MSSSDAVKIQHDVVIPKKEPETPEDEGEKSSGGQMPDLETDDNVDKTFEDTFGNPPKGTTIGDELEKDEKGKEDKEEDKKE